MSNSERFGAFADYTDGSDDVFVAAGAHPDAVPAVAGILATCWRTELNEHRGGPPKWPIGGGFIDQAVQFDGSAAAETPVAEEADGPA